LEYGISFTDFDHNKVAADLDISSWDSYPLGFLDMSRSSETEKQQWMRTGHPDFAAFHHDLYRGVGDGRLWVMEQQPGPVNWAPNNPSPLDGMVRFWSWEASDKVSLSSSIIKEVALIFDYESDWSLRVQPQGNNYQPLDWAQAIYTACRQCGVNIDILPPNADLKGYKAIVLANQQLENQTLFDSLKSSNAQIILGPRSFSKTQEYQVPSNLAPGLLQQLIPLRVVRVESLADFWSHTINSNKNFQTTNITQSLTVSRWREFIETDLEPRFISDDNWGLLYQHQNITYINSCMEQDPHLATEP